MHFLLVGEITRIVPIAESRGIRELAHLRRKYGAGRWRKLKGEALVRVSSGRVRRAELHWYEAHGIGRFMMKIKRFVD